MKKLPLFIIAIIFSSYVDADIEFYIFNKAIMLEGECTYYVRNVKEASFSCEDDMGLLSISIETPEEAERRYLEIKDNQKNEAELLRDHIKQRRESLRGITHYSSRLNNMKEFLIYEVCDAKACMRVTGKTDMVRQLFSKIGFETI